MLGMAQLLVGTKGAFFLSGYGGWLCDDVCDGLPSSFGFSIAVHPHDPMFMLLAPMVPLGPAAAALGMLVLTHHPVFPAAAMVFVSGGIVHLLVQDIAPQARLENAHAPALGSVLGFGLGLAGHPVLP